MAEIKDRNYISIQAFMVKDLGLKGNELITYALIYGFSQDGENYFKGSLSYMAEWLNCSKNTVYNIVKSLVDKGLLDKREYEINKVKFCEYMAIIPNEKEQNKNLDIHPKNCDGGVQKIVMGRTKNCDGGVQKTCTNNILDNLKDNINNIPQNPKDFEGKSERLDYERIAALYNTTCKDLPKVRGLSDERKRKIKTLLNSLNKAKVLMGLGSYEQLEYIFRLADESDFLSGRIQSNSWCGFDWLINAKNALKVIEGNYKNNGGAVNYGGNTRGFREGNAAHSCESENYALAAFRAGRGKNGGEDENGV